MLIRTLIAACSPVEIHGQALPPVEGPKVVTKRPKAPEKKGTERPKGAAAKRVMWRHRWNFGTATRTHLYWSKKVGAFGQYEAGEQGMSGALKTFCGKKFGIEDAGVEYDDRAGTWYCRRCQALAISMGVKFSADGTPLAEATESSIKE